MNLIVKFEQPEIKDAFEWQLAQDVNVFNDAGELVAKAELEIITLNKHRGAKQSIESITASNPSDWELPLTLFFKGQNLNPELCEQLDITADTKKARVHIMIEAISVTPSMRKQGVSRLLLNAIVNEYTKAQSIWLMSLPMHQFVDADEIDCPQTQAYYQALDLNNDETTLEQLNEYFQHLGFYHVQVDDSLLAEPLPFSIFATSPSKIA
ncbi:hypothetical protein [Colwellia sp. MEBiC06753]